MGETMENTELIFIRLPKELAERLKDLAKITKRPISYLVSHAIERYEI